MIGDISRRYDVGIFSFNHIRNLQGLMFTEEQTFAKHSIEGTIDLINLHQFPINEKECGHDKIWTILTKEKPTDIEKRIITAIEWVGKGLSDEIPARSFVQFIFGLEALLQYQQRGVLVSPSITYQISEFSAFILGRHFEDKLKTEKIVKELYSKRSAIAHGGTNNISEQDIYNALLVIKYLITTLLVNEEFLNIETIDQLNEWVKGKKYS